MAGGRPNMVRADTIDLQDQDAPTAADHNKQVGADGIAPHQAAQFQQVQNERRSEEETLADAWNMAGQHGKEQDANGQNDAEAQKKADGNGATNAEGEDGSEDEDDDDDMMDRMSSSPSIEDGASSDFSFALTNATDLERGGLPAPQHGNVESAAFNQSSTPSPDSSPFVEVPRHLPLPRMGVSTPQSESVPQLVAVLSPFIHTPEDSPLIITAVVGRFYRAKSPRHRLNEDIDFEFVYALHTFVATVEGQANATKGDTMVLLDDSNSYWWLVRVVKDSSIGYLPAEHIETPTERLARLNKHRNIDLSQTMLGDNPEKTRNPLKKAMRRRTAKTVQFAAPTYVEASDYDYSSEDEDAMIDPYAADMEPQQEQVSDRGPPPEVEERNAPEEANVHATRRFSGESIGGGKASMESAASKASMDSKRSSMDDGPKLVDRSEAAPLKSRKGTPRNADSFLKDESIETRKISLTPGLLRDDTATKASSTESTRNPSFESLVKTPSPQEERSKRDSKDKKKDKKSDKKQGGMLSGLFKSKKKDKKLVAARDEGEVSDMEKDSAELSRSSGSPQGSTTAVSGNVSPVERMHAGPLSAENKAQARAKLQKTPPPDNTRVMSPVEESPQQAPPAQQHYYPPSGGFIAELEGDSAAYEMSTGQESSLAQQTPEAVAAPPVQERSNPLSPIASILRTGSTNGEPKPKKAKRSKQRVELDDFDEEPEDDDQGPNPFLEQEERSRQASQESDRLSASPVEISSPTAGTFMHGTESIHIPQMNVDSDEDDLEDEAEPSKQSDTSTSNPSFTEKLEEDRSKGSPTKDFEDSDSTPKVQTPQPTITTSASKPVDPSVITTAARSTTDDHSNDSLPSTDDDGLSSTATVETPISSSPQQPSAPQHEWDDVNLRSWFDTDDVKDMLAIIHHSKNDVDADPDAPFVEHPAIAGLYDEPRKGVENMMEELDGMLNSLLRRRGVVFN